MHKHESAQLTRRPTQCSCGALSRHTLQCYVLLIKYLPICDGGKKVKSVAPCGKTSFDFQHVRLTNGPDLIANKPRAVKLGRS